MRVAVGGIAPHRLAQPVDRRLRIALQPVGVAEVEDVVGVVRVGVRRLVEVVRRLPVCGVPPRRSWTTPRLFSTVGVGCASASALNVANASS